MIRKLDHSEAIKQLLICPWLVSTWSEKHWESLISQCYATSLMARVNWVLKKNNLTHHIPQTLAWHFAAANKAYDAHLHDVNREIDCINKALAPIDIKPVYLKGAAYIVTEENASHGRIFSDIDIYVPKNKINACEQILLWSGWVGSNKDDYDEKYYREWMHEIPPLINIETGATLDIHHNLSPVISRIKINANILEKQIEPGKKANTYVLSPEDRLLHSAIHLLTGEEFYKSFRDLTDLDFMLREYSNKDKEFWEKLISRAREMGVGRVLYYCFRYCSRILHTPIPASSFAAIKESGPHRLLLPIMDSLFYRTLNPSHTSFKDNLYGVSCFCLFLRSHWLKMPLKILIPHLLKKALITLENDKEAKDETTPLSNNQ